MNKLIAIILLTTIYISYSNERDSIPQFYTGEIVVVSENDQFDKTSSQVDLNIGDLALQRFLSIDKQINYIPGLLVQKNSKNESMIKLRGYEQREIGIFFDGVPISNQFDGLIDISNFALITASKIKVNKGLSSTIYGANNLAGSINIITENVYSKNSAMGEFLLGNINRAFSAKINQNFNDFFVTASFIENSSKNMNASSKYFGNEISNSAYKNLNAFVKVAYKYDNNSIYSLSMNILDNIKDIPINTETSKPRFWKMPDWKMMLLNITHYNNISDFLTIRGNLFINQNRNILKSYDSANFQTQNGRSSFTSTQEDEIFGGNLIGELDFGILDKTVVTLSFRQDKHSQQSNISLPWSSYESRLVTAGIEQGFSFGNFGGIAGVNYDLLKPIFADNKPLRPSDYSINYQLGIYYNFYDNLNVFANYSNKSRFPTLKEFYAEILGSNIANPDLTSETGRNTELGLTYRFLQNARFDISYYYYSVNNLIDIEFLPENQRKFVNIGEALFSGIEANLSYMYDNYTTNLSVNYLNSENKTPNADTTILTLRPEWTVLATLEGRYNFGMEFNIQYIYYANQYAYNFDDKTYFSLPNYGLLNFSIQQKIFNNFSVFISLNNILDELYYADWGYPQQGFNFQAGLKVFY